MIYIPQNAVKGQALADFLATHPCCECGIIAEDVVPWILYFDGSNTKETTSCLLKRYQLTKVAVTLKGPCTNNREEYEALLIGRELLLELGAKKVKVYEDSQLVIYQMTGEF